MQCCILCGRDADSVVLVDPHMHSLLSLSCAELYEICRERARALRVQLNSSDSTSSSTVLDMTHSYTVLYIYLLSVEFLQYSCSVQIVICFGVCFVLISNALKAERNRTDGLYCTAIADAPCGSPIDREQTVESIHLDVSRTFPQLCIFQKARRLILYSANSSRRLEFSQCRVLYCTVYSIVTEL